MTKGGKTFLVFAGGFIGGWAARSLADSPQGVGVKLLEVAINTKERLGRWAAVERERIEDMMAEARSRREAAGTQGEPAATDLNDTSEQPDAGRVEA